MQVVVGDTMRWAPPIERQIFKCPACSHEARQVVFGALPISTSGVATRPQIDAITVRTQSPSEAQLGAKFSSRQPRDVAATAKASAWERAVEKLHSRQAALKEREAAVSPIRFRAVPGQQSRQHHPR
jgi:hypothetical protein